MTAVAEELSPAQALPGWSITANLMPPEILASRRAKVVCRLVVASLVILSLLCVLTYALARMQSNGSAKSLKTENQRTTQLQAKQRSYNGLITLKGKINAVQTELASLFSSDVDLSTLVTKVLAARPASTRITNTAISITNADVAATPDTGASSLDTSTIAHLGTLTLTGTVARTSDVAAYLDSLAKVGGVIQPYPGPITVDKGVAAFTIAMTFNTTLLTHRFDVKNGK